MSVRPGVERLRRTFSLHGDSTAVVDISTGIEYSYRQLEDLASRTARALQGSVRRYDRVALVLPNGIEMLVTYFACLELGAVSVPINPAFAPAEIESLIQAASPVLVVSDTTLAAQWNSVAPRILWGSAPDDLSLASVAKQERVDAKPFPVVDDADLAHIVFSSGSTGIPKAIALRAGRILEHAALFGESHRIDHTSRFYNVLPLAYLGGWYNLALVPLLAGGTVVLDREFGAQGVYRYWATVLQHRVNSVWFTPSMLSALLAAGVEDETQRVAIGRAVRWAMVGMAPLSSPLKQKFEKFFRVRLQQSYGLSETFLFSSWQNDLSLPDDCVGRALPGYDLRIAKSDGEILVKGPWIFDGYWQQDDLTRNVFTSDGYFRTGDAGRLENDGKVFVTGRLKDLIIRGGVNIAPAEIETVLLRAPGVRDAAVVGVADELYGERIVAFVTPASASLEPAAVLAFCRRQLSSAKVPSSLVVLPSMPLNASGKIDKKLLQQRAARASTP